MGGEPNASGGAAGSRSAADAWPGGPKSIEQQRIAKFDALLAEDVVDLRALRALSWSGIPAHCRATAWPLLLGYLPPNKSCRSPTLQRKRREYLESVPQHFDLCDSERSEYERKTLHQILIDVPRTSTSSPIFQCPLVQRALERVLYIWALRHPASGYVQGINDVVTPFFLVFLSDHLPATGPHRAEEVEELLRAQPYVLAQAEADAFWCLSRLLDSVQDNYTFAQPGIQRMVFKLKELVARIDSKLHAHLMGENLHFIQFAFRWMNCLLLRELSLDLILRLWDTYLAEYGGQEDVVDSFADSSEIGEGFAVLHVYVCAALLTHWSAKLQAMEFQELVIFLQHLPTSGWCDTDVAELLSQAFVFKALYHNAPSHLAS